MGDERQRRDRGSAPPTPDAIAPQRHATSLPGPIVALQRSAGNRAVRSLLASPGFTLATYVHLLPEDLPDPRLLDHIIQTSSACDGYVDGAVGA